MPHFSNVPEHYLQGYLMKKMNDKVYLNIIHNVSVHKLNMKFMRKNFNKKNSFFKYILNKYL